jgi:murein DD-endopeptidase MepM/ murein hydrolase activator NlpD
VFWDEVPELSASPSVYHFHPVAFVENISEPLPYFPVRQFDLSQYGKSWLEPSSGGYGHNRTNQNGPRSHGGCDIYAPEGEAVYSIMDGKIISSETYATSQDGWGKTSVITIDHGDFIVRYAEVKNVSLTSGNVQAGQKIAEVKVTTYAPSRPMLHFEMYDKSETGSLSVGAGISKYLNGRPTKRRKDLMGPTPYLEKWVVNVPEEK